VLCLVLFTHTVRQLQSVQTDVQSLLGTYWATVAVEFVTVAAIQS